MVRSAWSTHAANTRATLQEKLFKVYGFTQDITARKRIEEAKRAGELHLRNVLNNMIAMMGLMTPGGILIEANRTALRVANLKQQEVFGLPLEESYWWSWSSEEQGRLREAIRLAAAGSPSRYDALLRIGEGEFRTIDFMLSPMFGSNGRIAYLIASAIDITERKQAEQALQKNKERLELLANVAEKLLRSEDPQAIIEDLCRVVTGASGLPVLL
jgi:PAS domain S-box-containing protein